MSAHVLVPGTLFRSPEERTGKTSGKSGKRRGPMTMPFHFEGDGMARLLTLYTHEGKPVAYPEPKTAAKFNETPGKGISWAAWSWNPVTGCLHGLQILLCARDRQFRAIQGRLS